jgi:DNA-binding transcriptional LysR family regulator
MDAAARPGREGRVPPRQGARHHAAIKTGIGIGCMPCAYGDADPTLRRLRAVELGFAMDIWVLTHPDLRGSARVRAFLDHATAYFEAKRDRFAGRDPARLASA